MNKIAKHTIQSRFALLLLAVFVGSLLIQPAHILFVHHGLSDGISIKGHEKTITTDQYKYCPICDFEFCTFISQKLTKVPQSIEFIAKQKIVRTFACIVKKSSHLFQLRAPPVF